MTGGALGVLTRPDGKTQVTFNGVPVYRFVEDQSGQIGGDGLDDAFDGQMFTWHAVTAAGSQPSAPATTSGSSGRTPGY